MALLKRKKAQQSPSDVKMISYAGSASTMSEEEHSLQYVSSHAERTRQLQALSKIDDITVIHGQLVHLLSREMYAKYEIDAMPYIKSYNEDDPRIPSKKQTLRELYISALKDLVPEMFGEVGEIICSGCRTIIDVSSTDCSGCGRVVAGANIYTESPYDDDGPVASAQDEKYRAFHARLTAFCRRDASSIKLTDKVLTSIRNQIEAMDLSYNHEEVMKRELCSNGERPGTSVGMLINAIGKLQNSKLYSYIELICQELWGWQYPTIDPVMFQFILDVYSKLRVAMDSLPAEEGGLIHQNTMLYMVLSLAFKIKDVNYIVKRENFKIPHNIDKQAKTDRFFAAAVDRAGLKPCELV